MSDSTTATQATDTPSHSTSANPEPPAPAGEDATKAGLASATASGSTEFTDLKARLKGALKQYPDFPAPGTLFEDILPIFADPKLHADLIHALEIHIKQIGHKPDVVVGLDARGFLFGPTLALKLGAGFVPVRKQGKLPGECEIAAYEKEYGPDFFQMQRGAITEGQTVLVVDDIIATGGSAEAAGLLVRQAGGKLLGFVFMLELDFLKGRDRLDAPVYTLLSSQESQEKAE